MTYFPQIDKRVFRMRKRVEICNKFDICSDQYYTDTVKRPVAINRNKMYMISMNKHAVKKTPKA